MKINDDKTLKELQTEFRDQYPFLKIEFYKAPHKMGEVSIEANRLDINKTVGQVRSIHNIGFIQPLETMTVATFEKMMQGVFGLNAQVFRKSYGKWLQTWATDIWTLGEQNKRSELLGNKKGIISKT